MNIPQVQRIRDAVAAECRDCGRIFEHVDAVPWTFWQSYAMHHHGTTGCYTKNRGRSGAILYGWRTLAQAVSEHQQRPVSGENLDVTA